MKQNQQVTPYLDWQPVLEAAEVFSQAAQFMHLSADKDERLFWVETRPEEAGRCALVMRDKDGSAVDLVPAPYSVRNRVMEYGGTPYLAAQGKVWFSNFSDQRLYCLSLAEPGKIVALTPEKNADGSLGKFAQMCISPDGRWLAFAYEKEINGHEPLNAIGIIDLSIKGVQEPTIIVSGADFYKNPIFSACGRKLAWLEWNHPYMPWDSTLLKVADFAAGRVVEGNTRLVAGSDTSSINTFGFSGAGEIFYNADFAGVAADSPENFRNVYVCNNGVSKALTRAKIDFQAICVENDTILALLYDLGRPALAWIDRNSGSFSEIKTPFIDFSMPAIVGKKILVTVSLPDKTPQLVLINPDNSFEVVKKGPELTIAAESISKPISVEFPTSDGGRCYGYYYGPTNAVYTAPVGDLPPVRVLVHGGPTGMTKPGFSKEKTFWTSQGYAIFDVNYRGSVGFGRVYRDALLGQWGVLEIQDVKDGLEYLRSKRMIGDLAVVSGGSAGGYTVQRLLTFFPDLFAAGASHFGIGNLVTLQLLTHKFESRYLEGLIGGPLETHRPEFEARSPINHLDNLKSPMIIFQGSEDKVVPPENSREMAEILAKKGILHEYHEYAGEAHGFRQKQNLVDSLQKESDFFKRLLKKASKTEVNSR